MKAIIILEDPSQRRPLLARDTPHALLRIRGDVPLLELQLGALAEAGVDEAVVVAGFGMDRIEAFVAHRHPRGIRTALVSNSLRTFADDLAACWTAREQMQGDFILLKGNTLFEPAVVRRLIAQASAPLTVAINQKDEYCSQDVKVSIRSGARLIAVSPALDPRIVDGESIGLMLFRKEGVSGFRAALETALREPDAVRDGYLSAVNELAQTIPVATLPITDLSWATIDSPEALANARATLASDPEAKRNDARGHRAQFSAA